MMGMQKKSKHCRISIPPKGPGLSYPSLPYIPTPCEVPSTVPAYELKGSFWSDVP